MKFKNGREIKENDPVHGLDHAGRLVQGKAIRGNASEGQRDFIFQHGVHKTVCPSLNLERFIHSEDASGVATVDDFHKAANKTIPAPATAEA